MSLSLVYELPACLSDILADAQAARRGTSGTARQHGQRPSALAMAWPTLSSIAGDLALTQWARTVPL